MDEEIKRIQDMSKEVKKVGRVINQNFQPNLHNDLDYMCKVFLERQLSQIESLIILKNKNDSILIARSMFEGALYLAYSVKIPEMCHRWRFYGYVIDIKRMNQYKSEGKDIPIEIENEINKNKEEVDRLFKKDDGSYTYSWYGNKSIRKIAKEVDNEFLRLYDTYYSPMSEYHHWGVASLVRRYTIVNDYEVKENDNDEIKLERANAILMAFSSLYSTMSISVNINQCPESIKLIRDLERKLKLLHGTKSTEIGL